MVCAGASEKHPASWDACSEMVALHCERRVFGPPVSEGHSFDTCASLVLWSQLLLSSTNWTRADFKLPEKELKPRPAITMATIPQILSILPVKFRGRSIYKITNMNFLSEGRL